MLKAYTIGFLGSVLAVFLAATIWFATQPRQEEGLLWGGTVYTSKQEFNGYLKSRGLSYKSWVARNPGAAPWEPATAQRATTATAEKSRRAAAPTPTRQRVEDWAAQVPLAPIALLLAIGCVLLLLLRELRLVLARVPTKSMASLDLRAHQAGKSPIVKNPAVRRPALPTARRLGIGAASGAARNLRALAGRYGNWFISGVRADVRRLRTLLRERNISPGDVAFGLLAVLTSGVFGLFVVLLVSS